MEPLSGVLGLPQLTGIAMQMNTLFSLEEGRMTYIYITVLLMTFLTQPLKEKEYMGHTVLQCT